MTQRNGRDKQLRARIAEIAARLMNDSGLRDFQAAKQKAASQLGVAERRHWPSNQEIEQALIDYQRLFEAEEQPERVLALRKIAVNAMKFLKDYEPRLVGSVLNGTATRHAHVQLHLFCDLPEEVSLYLEDSKIPFQVSEKRLRMVADEYVDIPVLRFMAEDVSIELFLFPTNGLRQAPLSPVDGKPMQRATFAEVEQLIGENGDSPARVAK